MARLLGKKAVVYFGTTSGGSQSWAGGDGYNWEVELEGDRENLEAWEDLWEVPVHRIARWRGRIEKYVTTVDLLSDVDTQYDTPTTAAYVSLYRGNITTSGAVVLQGQVIFSSVRVSTPVGAMVENMEFTGVGAPSTVTTQ